MVICELLPVINVVVCLFVVEERERTNNLQEDIVRISQEHAHKIDTLIAEHKKNITAMEDRLIQIRKEEITKREFCYSNHNPQL